MKLIVFSGFLGAGKTISILSLAKYLLRDNPEGENKLVIIENEVGETGIDDAVLGQAGYEVRSLLAGCICCTLRTDLTNTINEIAELYHPDYVIFEPSGVAYPDRIIQAVEVNAPSVDSISKVVLVDAKRWKLVKEKVPALVMGQLSYADQILLNKCDLVDEEALAQVEADLHEINPRTKPKRIVATEGISDEIWKEVTGE